MIYAAGAHEPSLKLAHIGKEGEEVHYYVFNNISNTADFANTSYDWENMLPNYEYSEYTDVQRNAVATLMYHCGVSVEMNYGLVTQSGSGAYDNKISSALTNTFGYDKSMTTERRDFYTNDEWEQLVYDEVKAGRPVLYRGATEGGGHAFICDPAI